MNLLADLLSLRRRQRPRVAVKWRMDVQVSQTDHYLDFFTRDIGLPGVRLEGRAPETFRQVLSEKGRANMQLHVPGHQEAFLVEAELRWGMGQEDKFQTGWKFTHVPHQVRKVLNGYIEAHPEELIESPGNFKKASN